jgi:hypothetical protein
MEPILVFGMGGIGQPIEARAGINVSHSSKDVPPRARFWMF